MMAHFKLVCVFILATGRVNAKSYYESNITTWKEVTCNLVEPQLKYQNGIFEVNETLPNTGDVWIGYLYVKVPFLLLGCASLQIEKGVRVNKIADCFTICGSETFGIKKTSHERSGLLCICVMGYVDTNDAICKGGDPNSLCNNCSEIYTQINVNASNVSGLGSTTAGDCLTYNYPQFKWQPCSRGDYIKTMCSNATYTDLTATATINSTGTLEWSAGNKLCLTNGRHPSFGRSITNSGFGYPQAQYYWTGIVRANILIKVSLKDVFSRFSNYSYVYVKRSSNRLYVTSDDVKKRALCFTGSESTYGTPETPKYTTEVTPSIAQSTHSETSVLLTMVSSPDVTTTFGSTSILSSTHMYTVSATDHSFFTINDGKMDESKQDISEKSPALGVGIGVSVGILFLVGGAVVIIVLKKRGILFCNQQTVNHKTSDDETACKENMTYGKTMEDNVAHHNYFILDKCERSMNDCVENYNDPNAANIEENYNSIQETEEPYEQVKEENCDYDHTIDLTSGPAARKSETVYHKLKIDRPGDNGNVQRHELNVVQISEDDYDTTSAVVTHGKDDVSDYNHLPRTAYMYKAGATGDDIKGDKGGDYDAIDSMTYKVAQPDESDYAHLKKQSKKIKIPR